MRNRRVAIYTRVSTDDQSTKAQESDLRSYAEGRKWQIQKIYCDQGYSGALEKRPAFDELLSHARRRKFDVVLVWKFDRAARSVKQLLSALETFRQLHIDFVSATEAIDTSLPSGELVFQIFAALAQFERTLIAERVRAGLREARRNGKRLGRPAIHTLSDEEKGRIRRQHRKGTSFRKLAKEYGCSVWSIHTTCSEEGRC